MGIPVRLLLRYHGNVICYCGYWECRASVHNNNQIIRSHRGRRGILLKSRAGEFCRFTIALQGGLRWGEPGSLRWRRERGSAAALPSAAEEQTKQQTHCHFFFFFFFFSCLTPYAFSPLRRFSCARYSDEPAFCQKK